MTLQRIHVGDTALFITSVDDGSVSVGVDDHWVRNVYASDLADALNRIDGFSVNYTPPITVPSYLGAVVERDRETYKGNRVTDRWVRYALDSESSIPWVNKDGDRLPSSYIAAALGNGAFETIHPMPSTP